jgi:hypothetical protein
MEPNEMRQELVTGDVVFARTATGPLDSGEWSEVGVVILPEDVGATRVRRPVVFTADGTLGELWPTVRARATEELTVVASQVRDPHELLRRVHEAVVSVRATAVDPAGAAVLEEFRRDHPDLPGAVEPWLGFRRLIEAAGPGRPSEEVCRRHCWCGNDLPCVDHS